MDFAGRVLVCRKDPCLFHAHSRQGNGHVPQPTSELKRVVQLGAVMQLKRSEQKQTTREGQTSALQEIYGFQSSSLSRSFVGVTIQRRSNRARVCCQAQASSEVIGRTPETADAQSSGSETEENVALLSRHEQENEEGAEVLIECKNVYKSFGEKHILSGASFKIRVGEAVGIIGPSGTGKSTVLRIMAGLLAPDAGEVIVCGRPRAGLISDEDNPRLRIGLVFQSAALFDSLTVRENVGFMLYEHSDLSDVEIREQVRDSLAAVGLKGVEERVPSELSGGMKKRVALARAIISDGKNRKREREVVMYDEPTAGLDPIASTVVEDLIRSLHVRTLPDGSEVGKIASYIVVTHQHSTIRRAVDRILFLHEGQVVWEGTTDEFDTTDNPIVRQFADGSLDGPIKY